jgi:hypothetical protein
MKSRIMLAVVLGILSVAVTVLASASSTHVQYSLPFTLTGGPSPACPMLPTGFVINGSIDGTLILNTSVTNGGVMHVEANSLELGSATDSNGATYVVNYHNHQSAAIPPGGFPFTVLENDHFNLVGNGLATQLQMHFVLRLTFISSSDPGTVQVVNVHGDPFDCDVI